MLQVANEARHKAYTTGDPIWNAVADFEVTRLHHEAHKLRVRSDALTDERIPYALEPFVEFAPVMSTPIVVDFAEVAS
jgi:hypothetical protein